MATLNWRTATTVILHDNLIPNPNAEHDLLGRLQNVRVAVEGSFLHIDPRQPQAVEAAAGSNEFNVHIVPATAVKSVTYREIKRRGTLVGF